jgi:hypothetical protein
MAFMRRLKGRAPPEGWDAIEASVEEFETQMRDAVAEDHEGKRKNETAWRIHRVHFEKNRFFHDIMYKQKAMSRELVRTFQRDSMRPLRRTRRARARDSAPARRGCASAARRPPHSGPAAVAAVAQRHFACP